jgi:homoserine dehydrogenase
MQINIGILGLGTVGSGVVSILNRHCDVVAQRAGVTLKVRRIATRTPGRERSVEVDPSLLTDDVDLVLNDPEIQIVAELIGGVEPARDYVLRAIGAGKSVVTANKELIAKHGREIFALAREKGVDVLFEGSVGGGIPLLKPMRESLVGNRVTSLMGIVNGTTNYILSKMTREGREFADVLAEAQSLGYAEADPTADIDGYDAMYKLAILGDIAFDVPVALGDIYREGIRSVSVRDIEYARELGFVIKLLAMGRRHDSGRVELRVHPALLPRDHPLANVHDVYNAVLMHGDATGDVMFYGRGAGSEPTGSAVVADLVEAARNWGCNARGRLNPATETASILEFADVQTRFCVRMQVVDRPGMLAQIATVFGDKGVSLESIVQKHSDGQTAEIFWMTHRTSQRAMARSLNEFNRLDAVRDVSSVLRVEGVDS